MFTVIGFMLGGMCVGFLLRNRRLPQTNRIITVLIWVLLFLLGIEVGGNEQIIHGFATLGVEAAGVTAAAVLGSCLAAKGLWAYLNKKEKKSR